MGGAHGEDRVEASGGAEIVFVTAFDQYAIEAFQVDAVDYLLKPVDPSGSTRRCSGPGGGSGRGRPPASSQAGDDGGRAEPTLANAELARLVKRLALGQGRRERLAVKVGERLLLSTLAM